MLCKQNEATVHLTEMAEGKIKKVDLCEECYQAKGMDNPTSFGCADLVMGLGAAQELAPALPSTELKCPACGYAQGDFKKSGRFGCAECYETFAEGLEGLLKNMHKGVRHLGKVPRSAQQSEHLQETLRGLQKALAEAVANEQYERAAELRDQLRALKEGHSKKD
jgi:protein arginine kinase activator